MKRSMLLAVLLVFLFIMPACSHKPGTKDTSQTQQTNEVVQSEESSHSEQTSEVAQSQESSQPEQTTASISNDLFKKNMESVNSYRRKIRTVTTIEGKQGEKIEEFAYIKSPFSSHYLLDLPTAGAYTEDIIIDGTMWTRMKKDDKWDKFLPGQWSSDPPRTFKYDLDTQMYPINYEKLTFKEVGKEEINGLNCIKYDVSGSYEDEFTFSLSTQKFPITLSVSGNIWIADAPVIKQAIIRQRITAKADIVNTEMKDDKGNPVHVISEDVFEDDIFNVNSTEIQPPSESETNISGNSSENTSNNGETQNDYVYAKDREPGAVAQDQAEAWTKYAWNTDKGRMIFELINGYLVGSFVNEDNTKIESDMPDQLSGSVDASKYTGDLTYNQNGGEFQFTMDPSGQSFTGYWKLNKDADWSEWKGQSIEKVTN